MGCSGEGAAFNNDFGNVRGRRSQRTATARNDSVQLPARGPSRELPGV
jgi:hypothetical protein